MVSNHSENDSNDSEPFYTEPEGWVNFGDVNPEKHGGIFVTWDGDMWKVVTTYGGITTHYVEPQDVWVDGNPENGFTDTFRGLIGGRHRYHDGVEETPDLDENWNLILSEIGHYARHYTRADRRHSGDYDGYWDELESRFGITEDDA